jgi:23S rRNA pseudouridine2605 synthase
MFACVGHPVLALAREAFGPLELGDLPPGTWRFLSSKEVEQLQAATISSTEVAGADEFE